MKKFLTLTFFGLSLLVSSTAFAQTHKRIKKQYVDYKSIQITESGIFIVKDGKQIQVSALFNDANGPYIKKEYCVRHDNWNFAGYPECRGCKADREAREENNRGK